MYSALVHPEVRHFSAKFKYSNLLEHTWPEYEICSKVSATLCKPIIDSCDSLSSLYDRKRKRKEKFKSEKIEKPQNI